jgi:hypothetical protein
MDKRSLRSLILSVALLSPTWANAQPGSSSNQWYAVMQISQSRWTDRCVFYRGGPSYKSLDTMPHVFTILHYDPGANQGFAWDVQWAQVHQTNRYTRLFPEARWRAACEESGQTVSPPQYGQPLVDGKPVAVGRQTTEVGEEKPAPKGNY